MAKKTKHPELPLTGLSGEDDSEAKPPASSASFEQSVARLSTIVEQLEGGDLPLEDSLRLFEEGVRLARASQAQLDAAEKKVEQLLGIDETGTPVVSEFEPD